MGEDGVDLGREFSGGRKERRGSVEELLRRKTKTKKKTHRVGETMMAPISRLPSTFSRRRIFSNTGITKANVFPDPVTAFRTNKEETRKKKSSKKR